MSIGRAVEAQAPAPERLIAHHVLGRWIGATVVAEAIGFAAAMAIGRGVYAAIGGEPTGLAGEALTIGLSLLVEFSFARALSGAGRRSSVAPGSASTERTSPDCQTMRASVGTAGLPPG